MVTGGWLWQWTGGHVLKCGGDGGLGVRAAFWFSALRLGYLWLYGYIFETLEGCSPEITNKHITSVRCLHRLQAGIRINTQGQAVGTSASLPHASSITLHPLRLVSHRWIHTAGRGQASKCTARVWCESRLPPLPSAFFNLLERCRQCGWGGAGRAHGHPY